MRTTSKDDGWWIVDIPDCQDCGPYETKDDAEDDRWGLERFYKHYEKPNFITGENDDKM